MNKQELLQQIQNSIQSGELTKEEINNLFPLGSAEVQIQKKKHSINVVNVLYGIGGLIIFSGVIALVVQNWDMLGSFGRMLITLGMAVILYISSVLLTTRNHNVLAQILFAVSLVLFPIGIGVMLNEMNLDIEVGSVSVIFLTLTVFSALSYILLRKLAVFALFAIGFGTILAYSFLSYILSNSVVSFSSADYYMYLTIVLGLSHGLFAYKLKQPSKDLATRRLGQFLFSTGTLGVLSGAIALGGIWDVLFAFVVVGTFLLSVYIHSRGMLILSSMFLIGYLFKITSEYFASSVGWPIALILIGIATIVVAIGTYKINQKYFVNAQLRSQENREEVAG